MPQLTADHFYKFFQCPHWIWYDIYGDTSKKKEMSPLLEIIYKGKMRDTTGVLKAHKKFDEIKPEMFKDLEEGFLATLELMKQGKNIYHGVLMSGEWVGMPDLLEARPGKSKLGDWHYVVYDAQQSLDLRDEYKFPLVFYSLILEQIQGVRPQEAYVIDPQGNERSFLVNEFTEHFHVTREQIEKILNGEKPAPFLKSSCKRTPWYSLCLEGAQECNDVSLIHRLSQSDQRQLYNIGIKTISDLTTANLDDLRAQLEDWPFDKLVRFQNQAKVLVSGQPMFIRKLEFPAVKHEVYFDIESDPTRSIDYLLGVLIKNTETEKTEYKSFLSKDKAGEKQMWQNFLDFLVTLEDFVIYHYAYYETQVFQRMVVQYGAPQELINKFKENTIDLHARFTDAVILPLYFYTLKDIAQFIGYQWANPGAGGAESVVWFNDWLTTGDKEILKKLLKYNEDDVRATLLVKEWLEQQKPTKGKDQPAVQDLFVRLLAAGKGTAQVTGPLRQRAILMERMSGSPKLVPPPSKPPMNPLAPTTPTDTPSTVSNVQPRSSTVMPAAVRSSTISPERSEWQSWFPSTATIGTCTRPPMSARTCACSGRPYVVRSPASRITSASASTLAKAASISARVSSLQWMSAAAATRIRFELTRGLCRLRAVSGDDLFEAIKESLKKAAAALRRAEVPFLLGGGLAAWARGAAGTDHDLDLLVRPADADRALEVLAAEGMRPERPPENWLYKAWDGEVLIDLIFSPAGEHVDDETFKRAEELEVNAVRMNVAALEDVLAGKLLALSEHEADYESVLEIARTIREQVDWEFVRAQTAHSPFAKAFFTLVEELGIVPAPSIE